MRYSVILLIAALSHAQGTKPKPAPAEYEVHASNGPIDIGAEYMVHSFSNGEDMFIAEQFLVVEVALFPVMKGDPVNVDYKKFGLRLNHKTLLAPVPPAQVADALRGTPWFNQQQQPGLNGVGGPGPLDGPVGGGGSSPYPPQRRAPAPPRAPEPDPPGGIERKRVSAEEVLRQTALPPGPHKGAVSGFVYFYYKGKSSSLKAVELDYDGVTLQMK